MNLSENGDGGATKVFNEMLDKEDGKNAFNLRSFISSVFNQCFKIFNLRSFISSVFNQCFKIFNLGSFISSVFNQCLQDI